MFSRGISRFQKRGMTFGDWGNGWGLTPSDESWDFTRGLAVNADFAAIQVQRATPGWHQDSQGNWQEFGPNVLRRTDLGTLMEVAATNHIRNPRGEGGTPGSTSLPANMAVFASNGLTTTFVERITVNGMPGKRLRIQGTATSTFYVLAFDSQPAAASAGQSWTTSIFVRRFAGTWNGIANLVSQVRYSGGAGNTVDSTGISPNALTRSVVTGVGGTGVTGVYGSMALFLTNGANIDITLDIVGDQLELGAVATSPIINAVGNTSSPVTRAADVPWTTIPALTGDVTLLAEVDGAIGGASAQTILEANAGGVTSERYLLRRETDASAGAIMQAGGFTKTSATLASIPLNTRRRIAAVLRSDTTQVSVDGSNSGLGGQNSTVAPHPTGVNRVYFGSRGDGLFQGNMILRFAAIVRRPTTTAELNAISNRVTPASGTWYNDWSFPDALIDIDFVNRRAKGCSFNDIIVQRAMEVLAPNPVGSFLPIVADRPQLVTGMGLTVLESRVNQIRNPRGSGAAAGVAPTNWSIPSAADVVTGAVVGAVTVAGLPGVRASWTGTSGTSGTVTILAFDAANVIPAANGQAWVGSVILALASGSFANVTSIALRVQGMDSGGSAVSGQSFDTSIIGLSGTPTTFTVSTTFSDPAVAFVRLSLVANWANSLPVNFAIDAAAPMLRQASWVGPPILNAAGVTNSATTQPQDILYLPISGVGLEYTLYAEIPAVPAHISSNATIEAWANGSHRARMNINQTTNGGTVVSVAARSMPSLAAGGGQARKLVMRVKDGDVRMAVNGVLGTVDTGLAPAVAPTRLYLGSGNGGAGNYLNMTMWRAALFGYALSDAELVARSTM